MLGWFLRIAGVVPLRRASDEKKRLAALEGPREATTLSGEQVDQARNADAFRAILDRLEKGGAILIFPEGKSHDEPALAPLRTGPLYARQAGSKDDEGMAILLLARRRDKTPRVRLMVVREPLA